jgi:hypothetical protein
MGRGWDSDITCVWPLVCTTHNTAVKALKPNSDLAGLKAPQPEVPDHGSIDPLQIGTSEIQQVSPELWNSPSLNHYLALPEPEASFAPANDHLESTDPRSGSSPSAASGSGRSTKKSFLRKVVSKLKFWRRISGPVSVRDAVNAARTELQGLVDRDTGAYVTASFPRVTNVLPL